MANKLYTKGYLRKRLRECGIETEVLPIEYDKDDVRYWSLLVKGSNHILTCFKTDDEVYFKLFTAINIHTYRTNSAEVLGNEIGLVANAQP